MTRKRPGKPLPSANRTFRLDRDTTDKLRRLAEKDKLSVNSIVNRVLRWYLDWEVPAEEFGLIATFPSMIEGFFNCLDDKEARALGKRFGEHEVRDLVTFWFKRCDFHNMVRALEVLARYARLLKFQHSFNGKAHTAVIRHDMGPQASAYYGEALRACFARIGLKASVTETEAQVVARVVFSSKV